MKRQILGILAAALAAPYLVAFLMMLALMHDGTLKFVEPFGPFELFKFIPLGTMALVIAGLPLLLLASLFALLLHAFECRSRNGPVIGGAVLGLFFALAFDSAFNEKWLLLATGILPGAISGWIYWRIAIGNKCPLASPQDRSLSP